MWMDLVFFALFLLGVYYLIRYRINLKKAAELSKDALFPKEAKEFASILIPSEWKEMEPLSKETKAYRYVHWGTIAALLLLCVLLVIVFMTDWFSSSFFSLVYLFVLIISAVPHRNNLFVLTEGLILHARYYHFQQIQAYKIEKIIRWHELYGLNDRVNHAYKFTIIIKRKLFKTSFVVVEDKEHLEKMVRFLEERGIPGEEVQTSEGDRR